jgi:hypothetical protein
MLGLEGIGFLPGAKDSVLEIDARLLQHLSAGDAVGACVVGKDHSIEDDGLGHRAKLLALPVLALLVRSSS